MTIPTTTGPLEVADEAALIAAIDALAVAAGWTTYSVGTTPANSVWFQSTGEDGLHNIVGGFLPDTGVRRISGYVAADLDPIGFVGPGIGGYTNNDAAGAAPWVPVQSQTDTAAGDWATRDLGVNYRYIAAINKDAIAVLVTYESGGNRAQGFLYLGHPEPVGGRKLQVQARARIALPPAGPPNAMVIVLDRDISRALKDGTAYPSDPYTMALQFQSVWTNPGDIPDFALLERIPIVAGTLSAPGIPTSFAIDTTIGTKLAHPIGRYASGRGVGDIVSLMTEPNIVLCGASATFSNVFLSTNNNFITAWDAYCGQRAKLNCAGVNEQSTDATSHDPVEMSGRFAYYCFYALTKDNETSLVPQPDAQGVKNVGALKNVLIFPAPSAPDLAFFKISGDASRRYRTQMHSDPTGLRTPGLGFSDQTIYGIGPGW